MPRSPELSLKSLDFRREREQNWRELEALIDSARSRGITSLGTDELERLPLLYRAALSSLSVARAIALDRALIEYLDSLALRAFLTFYSPPLDIGTTAWRFAAAGFPNAVRRLAWHVLAAFLIFVIGVVSGFALAHGNEPYWFTILVPNDLAAGRGPTSTAAELHDVLVQGVSKNVLDAVGNILFAHNTLVALLMFGLGFLAGIPTIFLLLFQGLILGAFLELHYRRGLTLEFTGWLGIHGVTEILAFVLFAAAGLRLGEAVVYSRNLSRTDSLAVNGRLVAKVAVGASAMLFVAAILEGYFREAVHGTATRFAFAAITCLIWAVYLCFSGRRLRT